jgi:hypothetical protein
MTDLQMFVDRFGGAWDLTPSDPLSDAFWVLLINSTGLKLLSKRGANFYHLTGAETLNLLGNLRSDALVPLGNYTTYLEALNGVQVWVDYLRGGGRFETWEVREAAMCHQRESPQLNLVDLVSSQYTGLVARRRHLDDWIGRVMDWLNNSYNTSPGQKLEALDAIRREMKAWIAEVEKLARDYPYPPLRRYAARNRISADSWVETCDTKSEELAKHRSVFSRNLQNQRRATNAAGPV